MPPPDEISRIDDELRRAYDGDCWHGSPLRALLQGVTADVAAARHPSLAHSIWEVVLHLSGWVEVVSARITDLQPVTTPPAGDFPPVTDSSAAAWAATLEELDARHARLLAVVAGLEPARLDVVIPDKNYSVAVILHGIVQHYAYHAGQIALLKKLVR